MKDILENHLGLATGALAVTHAPATRTRRSVWFTAPRQVEVREELLTGPAAGQLLVETMASAVSAGTEMLLYRGEAPAEMAADETIGALGGTLAFPLKYGYACVGRVIAAGQGLPAGWVGSRIFAFNPHESCFVASPEEVMALPDDVSTEDALFLASMETAVSLVHDARPLLGERMLVFGQGVVGLLATGLLAAHGLSRLVTLDAFERRREASRAMGAHVALDPRDADCLGEMAEALGGEADLALDISGSPAALAQALRAMTHGGRVVIGSWFGTKPVPLDLGREFHRRRLSLVSSQVSTLGPALGAAWSKARRLAVAMDWLGRLHPARLISHRFVLDDAPQAYAVLDRHPDSALQIVLTANT
jgi:2-desacetyl-2-hydroxyethyl bacteriochlorophyllide A dehydrogenase